MPKRNANSKLNKIKYAISMPYHVIKSPECAANASASNISVYMLVRVTAAKKL